MLIGLFLVLWGAGVVWSAGEYIYFSYKRNPVAAIEAGTQFWVWLMAVPIVTIFLAGVWLL